MQPYSTRGVYVNYLGQEVDEGSDRVYAAYGPERYQKLMALKTGYDPTNMFRLYQNVGDTLTKYTEQRLLGVTTPVPAQDICIRTRELADLDGCVAALASVYESGGYPTNWPADPARWLTPSGTIHGWVAASEGLIVGHAILRQPSFSTGQRAELSRLFVTPAARRKGVAAALMQATMRWAAAKDLDLELEVTDHLQAARALYERSGFRLIDTKQAAWTTPSGTPVTLHHYAWSREHSLTATQKLRAPSMRR